MQRVEESISGHRGLENLLLDVLKDVVVRGVLQSCSTISRKICRLSALICLDTKRTASNGFVRGWGSILEATQDRRSGLVVLDYKLPASLFGILGTLTGIPPGSDVCRC